MKRSYVINTEECGELLYNLHKEENLKNKTEQFLASDTAYLDNISFISGNGRGYDIFQDQPEKQKKLIEAVKTDIQEAAPEDLLALPFAELHISYILPVAEDIHSLVPGEEKPERHAYGEINLFPSYKNTIAVLKETGYPLSFEETEIKKAKILYYNESGEEETAAEYTEKEQLEALACRCCSACWRAMRAPRRPAALRAICARICFTRYNPIPLKTSTAFHPRRSSRG